MADGDEEANFICKMIGLEEIIITLLLPSSASWFLCETLRRGCGIPGHPGLGEPREVQGAARGVLMGGF